jgi:hypothetical protein
LLPFVWSTVNWSEGVCTPRLCLGGVARPSKQLSAFKLPYTHIFNKGHSMKTTIEMSDPLFDAAKALAQRSQTTLRALIEEGLRRVISDSQAQPKTAFKLKDASVRGKSGPVLSPLDWQQLEQEHVIARVIRARAKRPA